MLNFVKKIVPWRLRNQIRLLPHRGRRYLCPFCGFRSKDLAPLGFDFPVIKEKQIVGAGLRNARCYSCGSTDRERLVYLYLTHRSSLFEDKGARVLHMAPEKRLSSALLTSGLTEYVCGDLFAEGYSYPDHVKHINVLDIPFNDDHFDVVLCNHMLEHVPDDAAAMMELRRVMRPSGFAILQVPISLNSPSTFEDFSVTDPKKREVVFGQGDHLRIYGQDYVDRLSAAGFSVERFCPTSEFDGYGINDKEVVFVARKIPAV